MVSGFITPLPEGEEPPKTYSELRDKIPSQYYGEDEINPWGHIVVDRQFMTEKNSKIFWGEDNE